MFNPSSYISSKVFSKFVSALDLKDKLILDMGCGSGIISIFAASRGASCIAADINPAAVDTVLINALQNGFKKQITAIQSDLFTNIKPETSFDIIFFNPPYFKGTPLNDFEIAFKGGDNYEVIQKFISQSKQYLKPNGKVILIFSSDMPYDLMPSFFKSAGFEFIIIQKQNKLFETFYIIEAFL